MEESKFINEQSLEVLRKQTNSTLNQRMEELETNVQNIFNYLQQQQEFLEKHQAYVDDSIEKVASQLTADSANQHASINRLHLETVRLSNQIRRVARTFIVSIVSIMGLGLIAWLVK